MLLKNRNVNILGEHNKCNYPMNIEEFTDRLRRLGIDVPAGTLRRWAAEGLITAPKRIQNPEGRGRLSDWPETSVEEAAACWAVRHLTTRGAPPTIETIRKVRLLSYTLYERPFDIIRGDVKSDGTRSLYLFSSALHPLVINWAVTVEKVRRAWPVLKPARLTFRWTIEGREHEGTLKNTLAGITLEQADRNSVSIHSERSDI